MTKKTWIAAALLLLAAAAFAQEHTIYYSGWNHEGHITVTRDPRGKLTITYNFSRAEGFRWFVYSLFLNNFLYVIDRELCPLLDQGQRFNTSSFKDIKTIVVDGNTETVTGTDGSSRKTVVVVKGNTTTTTDSDGYWIKTVTDGNTTITTYSGGHWEKTVTDGNTTITTYSDGSWKSRVDEGNTRTFTNHPQELQKIIFEGGTTTAILEDGGWQKKAVSGNTTTFTFSGFIVGEDYTWYRRTVERRGNSTFVREEVH